MFRVTPVRAAIAASLVVLAGVRCLGAQEPTPERVRAAVTKALPLLVKGAVGHVENRSCFACHNQGVPLFAMAAARSRGFAVDEQEIGKQVEAIVTFLDKNREAFLKGKGTGGQVDTAGYALLALEKAGHRADENTAAVAEYLLLKDQDKAIWRTTSNRPPSEVSQFTVNYLGLRGLQTFGTPAQKERIAARSERVAAWVAKTPPRDTEDRVFRLLALQRAGAPDATCLAAARDLLQMQTPDGGWAQLAILKPDAYATGSALVALYESGGLSPDDPASWRALAYLLRTQLPDGSWHVVSRSKPFQTYFESGFPHGKDQFISMSASAWATAALAMSLPKTDGK